MKVRRYVAAVALSAGGLSAPLLLLACSREESAPGAKPPAAQTDSAESGCGTAAPPSALTFEDVTSTCGIDFVHDAGATPEKHLPETMGGGAALFDADEDGDLDAYFVQGGPLPLPGGAPDRFAYPSGVRRPTNRLYANDGRGHFQDATERSGDAAVARYGMGVAVGDANGDGHEDLYLTVLGDDVLLQGDGRARFRDVTRTSGIVEPRWTTGAAFFDADDDGDLDLFVTSYVTIDLADPPWCGERKPGWRSYCHPDRFPGDEDRFWRNRGDGTFEDRTKEAGFSDPNGKGLCVLASDLDGDGRVDLYVANDSTENRLYRNLGGGRFEDATLLSGTGVDRYGRTEASMGVASGDVDGDQDLDLFVTGFDDESDTLYTNQGGMVFEDRTVQAGLELATRLPVGFGCLLEDLNLDGALDLCIANGHIIDNIALYHDGKTYAQKALVYRGDREGRFADVSGEAGVAVAREPLVGRGLLAGDLDGDGKADLLLTQCGGAPRVFRNVSANHGLIIAGLPFGTRVELLGALDIVLGVREAIPAPSYLGSGARDPRFGLHTGDLAHGLRLRVPGGSWQELKLAKPLQSGRIRVVREAGGRFALAP
ncbi:MAG: VCBS repeat-containing protein [Planctomycetota bacterium]|nr:VCBS repeat-containing protein [Planctomycetota bacterium]